MTTTGLIYEITRKVQAGNTDSLASDIARVAALAENEEREACAAIATRLGATGVADAIRERGETIDRLRNPNRPE